MQGSIDVRVHDAKSCYEFTLHRNIAVLNDEGASGKTSLTKLILNAKLSSGIKVYTSTGVDINVINVSNWDLYYDSFLIKRYIEPQIFIVDESTVTYISKQSHSNTAFASFVWNSGCYFIIISRENLKRLFGLSCSTKEIYALRTLHKITQFVQAYPQTTYGDLNIQPSVYITEDSNSGMQLFEGVYGSDMVKSAKGKDQIYDVVQSLKLTHVVVIVDGAAFGFNMHEVLILMKQLDGVLIAEESFEYVILTSGIFSTAVSQKLTDGMLHIDCAKYTTWERFFTDFLKSVTQNSRFNYNKKKLSNAYFTAPIARAIIKRYALKLPELLDVNLEAYLASRDKMQPLRTHLFDSPDEKE